jgi:hypothetical protein
MVARLVIMVDIALSDTTLLGTVHSDIVTMLIIHITAMLMTHGVIIMVEDMAMAILMSIIIMGRA